MVAESSAELVPDHLRERVDELRTVVERRGPAQLHPAPGGPGARLDGQVVEDLQVVGDEADRADQRAARARTLQRLQQVRTQPGLAGVAGGLEGELPWRQRHPLLDLPARLQQPA